METTKNITSILNDYHPTSLYEYRSDRSLLEYEIQQGYWYYKGKVYNVTDDEHLKFVLENPSVFNYTTEEIEEFLNKYPNKNTGYEELMKSIMSNGWLRIRHWTSMISFWMIGCYNYTISKLDIIDFCYWAIDKRLMSIGQQLTIIGYDGTDKVFKNSEGGIETFLNESILNMKKSNSH